MFDSAFSLHRGFHRRLSASHTIALDLSVCCLSTTVIFFSTLSIKILFAKRRCLWCSVTYFLTEHLYLQKNETNIKHFIEFCTYEIDAKAKIKIFDHYMPERFLFQRFIWFVGSKCHVIFMRLDDKCFMPFNMC